MCIFNYIETQARYSNQVWHL